MQIQLKNLSKHFGTLKANDSISLAFASGQIHGVLGENGAGKSTMMKLLSGFLRRSGGDVLLDGQPAALDTPAAALRAGIGMLHQDPLDIPAFSVLENVFCASPRAALPKRAAARTALATLGARLNFLVPSEAPLSSLTVGQRQQIEIMRLLTCGAEVLILDEPTTGISASQATALFAALRRLAGEGKTILFVSHKLEEIAQLCDTASVLRAGQVVGEQLAMPQNPERLLELMFGRLPQRIAEYVSLAQPAGTAAWQLDRVTLQEGQVSVHNLSLAVRPGEVIGLAGLEGSGQRLLLEALAGHLRPLSGRVLVAGQDLTGRSVRGFLDAGIQFLPADRLADGIVGAMSLREHMALLHGHGLLTKQEAALAQARAAIADYAIKATPDAPLRSLSGGNQQRAMLALLPARCRGILMEHPTRGLDVNSARSVWQRLLERRGDGTALVFASADLDEILAYSDRVLVFFAGQASRPIPRAELTGERLAELIGGVGF